MNGCEQANRLGAYHDGELAGPDRAALERHLRQCPSCAAELARIRRLTDLVGSATPPAMPRASLDRLHRAVESVRSTGIVSLAEAMAAIAATILLTCILTLALQGPAEGSTSPMPAPWEVESVRPQSPDAGPGAGAPEESLMGWMVQGLYEKDEHD